jgi:uncharacterized membrane protein YhaH (DUF805 family)
MATRFCSECNAILTADAQFCSACGTAVAATTDDSAGYGYPLQNKGRGGFRGVVNEGFGKYGDFTGRASRSQFWYWVLFVILGHVGVSIAAGLYFFPLAPLLPLLWSLAVFVPNIAVCTRRLHDTNRTGWQQLWAFVPLFGWIYLMYLCVQPSDVGPNDYGPAPDW